MSERSDYTHKGDTFWIVNEACPSCSDTLASNGTIYTCYNCGWWELIEEHNN